MLYREIIAVCSEIHTTQINTLCGQNLEFVDVRPGRTYSNRWALNEIGGKNMPLLPSTNTHNLMLCRHYQFSLTIWILLPAEHLSRDEIQTQRKHVET
jgi:hypothetical protein